MTLEAHFKLLEYEELKQARIDSKEARREAVEAMKWAKYAIWVAVGLGLIQVLIEVWK